jgi:hypothetical protein
MNINEIPLKFISMVWNDLLIAMETTAPYVDFTGRQPAGAARDKDG